MFPEKRRNEIIQLLIRQNSINVSDLAKRLNVSSETIRRDLRKLQQQNIIKKTYGMVSLLHNSFNLYVPTIQERKEKEKEEKIAITKEAIKIIKNNKFILIDAGSTTEYLAELVHTLDNHEELSIITNGLNIAYTCSKFKLQELFIVGGILRPSTLSIVGPQSINEIKKYNIDIAFMGTTGVSLEKGFSSSNLYEVETKRAMISVAKSVIVLADHTKFNKYGLQSFCSFQDINYFITSNLLENSIIEYLEKHYGKKLIIAKMK